MRIVAVLMAATWAATAVAHPGSGIVVDRDGTVYFADTGAGVWKVDRNRQPVKQPGPAWHWMAIDRSGWLAGKALPRAFTGEVVVLGRDPTYVLAASSPVAVAADGTIFYSEVSEKPPVRIMRLVPPGKPEPFATLPAALETAADGKPRPVPWIHGLAAGPGGTLYYSEQRAVRKIAPDGTVSFVAEIAVPDCARPPGITEERVGPALRGLEVKSDGTVFVAASGCSAVVMITPDGTTSVVARGESPWSPTGVAISGDDLYILEYTYIEAKSRADWVPRVRKLSADGQVTVVGTVTRTPPSSGR